MEMSRMETSLWYISHYIGTFYKWGGDDPSAFDCSGICVEYLKSAGILARDADHTAQGLWNMFPKIETPFRGCLVYYWNSDKSKIIHVEIMLNDKQSLGASGGGSKTLTEADAIRQNAFVKVNNIYTRNNLAGFNDPWTKKP